jgi:putative ABC transport system permease protein
MTLKLLAPRWKKIWRDLWVHKSRTALVVLSIAIGVFAVGVISGTKVILSRELARSFEDIQPSSAIITTMAPFDDEVVESVRAMDEVSAAEGRSSVMLRIRVGPDEWRNMQVFAVDDYEDMTLDKVLPDSGAWPPAYREIIVERSGLGLTGVEVGDTIVTRTPSGKDRELEVAGTAFDVYALLYTLDGLPWAYATTETMEWLGQVGGYNELHIVVAENADDKDHVADVVSEVRDKLERGGRAVFFMTIPEPGKHPLDSTIQAILLVLGALGVLALLLSAFLVTNVMAALLAQEVRYIGVMKAIGARRRQIVVMYSGMVVVYGLLALAIAVPLGVMGTIVFANVMAKFLNLTIGSYSLPPTIIAGQVAVALIVPLLASLVPIVQGTRITVQEAITSYGLGSGEFGTSRIDRAIERLRGLPRPVLLSLRNTFRRKGRLALTVLTLTLSGAMFIAVMSVNDSLENTIDNLMSKWRFDISIQLDRPYRVDRLRREALRVPGVADVEGWGFTTARHMSATEKSKNYLGFSMPLIIAAPPADTKLLKPPIVDGRWLLPEDENALVVTSGFLADEPDLEVGDYVELKIGGRDSSWRVVGIAQGIGAVSVAYAPYDYYSRMVRDVGKAQYLAVVTQEHDPDSVAQTARDLEAGLQRRGIRPGLITTIQQERAETKAVFTAILALLIGMVLVLAVVGGLGLAGTMSLNVIERTREIGVMRAIGATRLALVRIFVLEGVVIGVLSWILGAVLALPLSIVMSRALGQVLLQSKLAYGYSLSGALLWLLIAVVVASLASLMPARAATRVTVREVLSYE